MKILLVSQHFWPESFRINEVVSSLAERRVSVSVLTGKPNYPGGKVFDGYQANGFASEVRGGARIFRVPIFPRGHKSALRLTANYLSFIVSGLTFGPWLLRKEQFDAVLVYATSPLLQALPALFIGWLKRIPVVVYVQDLWPESLEATGYVRNKLIIRLVELLVRFIYQHSDLILVSSRPFRLSIERFSPSAKIIYYPNSVDPLFCDPGAGLKTNVPVLDDGFCVVFAGNIGAAQGVHVITEAAIMLKEFPSIRIVILGAGSELDWVSHQIIVHSLDNLFLAGQFPVDAMPNLLSRASVLLATLADKPIFEATVPNKIQAYMAVGRPIIVSMNGEGAKLVQEAGAGLAVKAEDGKALADAIVSIYNMPQDQRERLGENARSYYWKHFDHERLVSDLIQHLENLIHKPSSQL